MLTLIEKYKYYIYERYKDLKNSQIFDYNFYNLCKI